MSERINNFSGQKINHTINYYPKVDSVHLKPALSPLDTSESIFLNETDVTPLPGSIYTVIKNKNLNYAAKIDTINEWGAVGVTQSVIKIKGRQGENVIRFKKDATVMLFSKIDKKLSQVPVGKGEVCELADGGSVSFLTAKFGQETEERLVIITGEGYIITQAAKNFEYIISRIMTPASEIYINENLPKGILKQTLDDTKPLFSNKKQDVKFSNESTSNNQDKKISFYV